MNLPARGILIRAIACSLLGVLGFVSSAQAQAPSFAKKIAPLLIQRCSACHSTRKAEGRLNLDSYGVLMRGGESGPAVVPGDPEKSLLWSMCRDQTMPKEAPPLAENELAQIRDWIASGAQLDPDLLPTMRLFEMAPPPELPLAPLEIQRPLPVISMALHPRRKWLATSGYREILLWDLSNGKLLQRIGPTADRLNRIVFSPDGDVLAVASGVPGMLGKAQTFLVSTGKLLQDYLTSDEEQFAVAIHPEGTKIAFAGGDRFVRLFNLYAGYGVWSSDAHSDWVWDLEWSSNGYRLASASRDKTCKVFDGPTGWVERTFHGHKQPATAARFVSLTELVSAGREKTIYFWSLDESRKAKEVQTPFTEIWGFALRSKQLGIAGNQPDFALANADNGEVQKQFPGHQPRPSAFAFSKDGSQFVTGDLAGNIRLWDRNSGKRIQEGLNLPPSSLPKATP